MKGLHIMKNNTRKILLALLIAITMLVSVASVTAFAADGTTVYLEPTAEWDKDGARFAVYYWLDDNDNGWVDMESIGDGIYKATVPAGYSNIIFVRMSGDNPDNTWDNKWNQTIDLVAIADDTFTITDPWAATSGGTWASGAEVGNGGSTDEGGSVEQPGAEGATSFTVAGVAGLCGSEWTPADVANDMTYNEKTGLYEKLYTGVPAGTYEFKVAADHSWDRSWGDPVNGVGQYGTDCQIILENEQNVTITFNPKTLEVAWIISESTGPSENTPGGSVGDSTEDVVVYLENVAGWTEVYIYYWSDTNGSALVWPGILMDYEEGDVYSAVIPAGNSGVIFNNGNGGEGNQTSDLAVPSGDNNYFVNDNLAGSFIKNPNAAPEPEQPDGGDGDGNEEPKEMTWLQKLAKSLLLFLRSIEDFFKNMFNPASKQ